MTLICPCCASTDVCGVEYPAIYDGVLVWQCEHCLHAWPRWHDGKRGKAASELADHINGYDQEDQ